MSSLHSSVSSLYRGLDATRPPPDPTYESERIAVLHALKLIPEKLARKAIGETSQFNSATAGLGLFARNRGIRAAADSSKKTTKSHKEIVMDRQNLKKRLLYTDELNTLARSMGTNLMNSEEIPASTWLLYDRMRRNPKYRQKTKVEMEVGPGCLEPGPGAYLGARSVSLSKTSHALPVTFGRCDRWKDGKKDGKKDGARVPGGGEGGGGGEKKRGGGCLGQKEGVGWSEGERYVNPNGVVWEAPPCVLCGASTSF